MADYVDDARERNKRKKREQNALTPYASKGKFLVGVKDEDGNWARNDDGSFVMRERGRAISHEVVQPKAPRIVNGAPGRVFDASRSPSYEQKVAQFERNRKLEYLLNGNRAQRQIGLQMLESDRIDRRKDLEAAARQHQLDLIAKENEGKIKIAQVGADAQRYTSDNQLKGTMANATSQENVAKIGADAQRYTSDNQLKGTMANTKGQLKAAQIGADAQRYTSDNQLKGTMANIEGQRNVAEINKTAQIEAAKIGASAQTALAQIQHYAKKHNQVLSTDQQLSAMRLVDSLLNSGLSAEVRKELEMKIELSDLSPEEKAKQLQELNKPTPAAEIFVPYLMDMLDMGSKSSNNAVETIDTTGI